MSARAIAATLWIVALFVIPYAGAQQPVYDENRIKAAFLVRFAQFVEWPQEQPAGALVITIAGSDAVHAGLVQLLSDRGAQGRPIVVRQLKSAEDLADTHIFFVGAAAKPRIDQLVASVGTRPILVVSDTPDALERGSMINFVTVDRRIRFEIALENAEKAGLTLSSRLLSIATRIHRGGLTTAPLAVVRTEDGRP
jgi:hypothetical protein